MKVRSCIYALLLAVAFSVGILTSPLVQAASASSSSGTAADTSVGPDFKKVAETGILKLFFNKTNSQLIIQDKRNGKLWYSNPPMNGSVGEIGDLWQQQVGSVFVLTYTSDTRDTVQITNSATENPKLKVKKLSNGVAVTYDIQGLKMRFTVNYTIKGDHFDVTVVDKSFSEKMMAPIVALEMLPFFGASSDDDKGYAFFPDGSGAISKFKKIHPEFHQNYAETIYGADQFTFPAWDTQMGSIDSGKERIQLPVFGMVNGKNAFLGTVTKGDSDAKVLFSPSGYVVNFTRVSTEFQYRKQFQAAMRRNVYADRLEKQRIKMDRAVRYTFLVNKDANYVGMAKKYREYLVKEKGVKKLAKTKDDMPFSLRVFNGVLGKGVLFQTLLKMTTFDETKEIVKELEKRGIKNIELTMVGWNKNGYDGLAPKHMPADRKLGGDSGLNELIKFAVDKGYSVYLEDDFLNAFRGHGGFINRVDTARGTNKMPYLDGKKANYILNPVVSLEKFAKKLMPKMAERYEPAGIELRYAGVTVLTDRNLLHPLERKGWIENWVKIMDEAKKNFKKVSSEGGNAYVLGHVDRVSSAPMESNEYLFSDQRVPFWQIATHGLVTYTGNPGNLRSDYTREFLRDLEYGAIPLWEFAYRLNLDLKDTAYNRLFTYLYKDWLSDASKEYKNINNGLGHTYSMFIENHEQLAEEVFATTYEDGTKIIVNYDEKPAKVNGMTIKGLSYKIIKGRSVK